MLKILPNKRSGGSPWGWSFYKGFLGCPNRTYLGRKYEEEGGPPPTGAIQVGTLFHGLMESYYDPDCKKDPVVLWKPDESTPDWEEALRLYRKYIATFSAPYHDWEGAQR